MLRKKARRLITPWNEDRMTAGLFLAIEADDIPSSLKFIAGEEKTARLRTKKKSLRIPQIEMYESLREATRLGRISMLQTWFSSPGVGDEIKRLALAYGDYLSQTACSNGHVALLGLLENEVGINVGARIVFLMKIAVRGNQPVIAASLLARAVKENKPWHLPGFWEDAEGSTPLYRACLLRHLEVGQAITRALGSQGLTPQYLAFVNAASNYGYTALMTACRLGHLPLVKHLVLEAKASLNQTHSTNKKTALYIATRCNQKEVVRFLLSRPELDVNLSDHEGFTPLMAACERSLDLLRLFIQDGRADISLRQKYGGDALFMACGDGSLEIVRALVLEAGARTGLGSFGSPSPLQFACYSGHFEVVKFLIIEGKAHIRNPGHEMWTERPAMQEELVRACAEALFPKLMGKLGGCLLWRKDGLGLPIPPLLEIVAHYAAPADWLDFVQIYREVF
jgi:ankyrin repeat protein